MPTLQINALDTVFFRDAKPFSMGEETWANSLFPHLLPSAFYGSLRTAFALEKGLEAEKIEAETADFKIKDLRLLFHEKSTFAMPLDLVAIGTNIESLSLATPEAISPYPFPKILKCETDEDVEDLENYYLCYEQFKNYLNGHCKIRKYKKECYDLREYSTSEPKIGIARTRETRTTKASALYRVGMSRLEGSGNQHKTSFYVEYKGLDIAAPPTIVTLGGDGKKAIARHVEEQNIRQPIFNESDTIFKLYIATPSIFTQGAIPDFIDPQNGFKGSIIEGIEVKLLTCAIGKFLALGGFDLVRQAPKPMQKAVPAGSVYYFELIDSTYTSANLEKLIAHFNIQKNSICQDDNLAKQGYGICYIGKIPQQ